MHGRTVVFVDRLAGVTQIVAGHRGRLVHDVAGACGGAGQHFQEGRQDVVVRLQRRRGIGERAALDQGQAELRRRLDDLLGAIDFGHARKLDENLIVFGIARDDGLGDAELVDASLDGVARLIDRVPREIARRGWFQPEDLECGGTIAVAAVLPAIDAIECVRGVGGDPPERRGIVDAIHLEFAGPGDVDAAKGHAGLGQRRAQAFGGELRVQLQRLIGLDAQHEMNAAIEIQPEFDLLARRHDRPQTRDDDGDDDEESLANRHTDPLFEHTNTHEDTRRHSVAARQSA